MNENFVVGRNAVEQALGACSRVNRLLIAKRTRATWLDAIVEQARANKVRYDFVPEAKLNQLAGTRDHQGVAAVVSPVQYASLDQCVATGPQQATLLALDGVQNPRNLGMLIRTALGAGVSALLLPARGGALLDGDVVRASAGAVLHLPVVNCGNLATTLGRLRDEGFWIYGLDAEGESEVFDTSWPERTVLVAGNETEGLRPGVRKACDALVRIPLANDLDSLNVVVAAGVTLFHLVSQRRQQAH